MTTAQSSATAPPRSANPPATFATADDWEFSREILPQVSRTFALSISALPERLSRAVGTAYLMCRIVDTIEDDAKLDPAARDRAFFAFDQLLIDDKTASSPLLDIVLEHRIGGDSPDHRLCGRADAVFRCFRALSLDQRAAIRPHVLEMSRGMREFTERADRLGELRLADMAEVERYCYFVAGTVGKLLTALFELEVPQLSPQLCSQLRARAVSFGLALQLVNILKDVAEDHRRGDCFLPAEWALEEGVELDELLAPEHREAALAVVARVAARAREHLRRAEAYTLLWPTEDASARAVRLFCAVPLTLALATLDQIESGDDTLRHDRKPKVSRELVADVFRRAQSGARDDRVLGALFAAHGGASLAPSGSSSTVAKLAQSAGEGGPRLRRFRGRALVTGATGHLGANLVRRLLDEGVAVRALILAGTDTEALDELADVELVYGDLRQPATLAAAVAGCETVYHTAALVSTLQGDATHKRDVFETNVLGTRHLLRAADAAGVKRVVVTGSFGANGYHRPDSTRPADEDEPFYPFDRHLPYARTKHQVEHEVLKAIVELGLDVVMCTSTAILGPHDYVPSRMGRTLLDFSRGKLRAYIPGGFEFVAAADLCDGHILAMEKGRTGHKYTFATQYLSLDDIMELFEEVTGRARPKTRLPAAVMHGLSHVTSFVLTQFFPRVPQRFTPDAVRILRLGRRANIDKARRELGFVPGDIRQAITAAYDDFARRGLVVPRASASSSKPSLAVPPADERAA